MTHYIGTIYFLGKYRPLSVEGDNLEEVMIELSTRAKDAPQEDLLRRVLGAGGKLYHHFL